MIKDIVGFDLETTGVEPGTDRIVQIAGTKMKGDLKTILDRKMQIVNPGIPIPPKATEVHGITDETVKDKPFFKQLAKGIAAFTSGCDLFGYNIARFDIPLMAEEMDRVGILWPEPGTLVVDACQIYHLMNPRDLSAAYKQYTGKEMVNAHDATADVDASFEVLNGQLATHEELAKMTREELAAFCSPEKRVDWAGKIILNDDGVPVYSFGKDKDLPIKANSGFAMWMLKQSFITEDTKRHLNRILGWAHKRPADRPALNTLL